MLRAQESGGVESFYCGALSADLQILSDVDERRHRRDSCGPSVRAITAPMCGMATVCGGA